MLGVKITDTAQDGGVINL